MPSRSKILWLYTKYQLITKVLLAVVVLPIYFLLLEWLIKTTGRTVVAGGDYLAFLWSFQGIGALILSIMLLMLLVGIDINSFIIMSALIHEGRTELTASRMILVGIKSLKLLLRPSGLLIVLYVSIVIPILGLWVTVTPMQSFQIPNFIVSVIYANPWYLSVYLLLLLALFLLGVRYLFALHYIMIAGDEIKIALKKSAVFLKKRHWRFIKDFVIFGLGKFLLMILVMIGIILIPVFLAGLFRADHRDFFRFTTLFMMLNLTALLTVALLMLVPIIISLLTKIFYKYNLELGHKIKFSRDMKALSSSDKMQLGLKTRVAVMLAVVVVLTVNALTALGMTVHFDKLFKRDYKNLAIVAHRGGGDLGAENSLDGLEQAIRAGVSWSEIDIQRTKDGFYIVQHDMTFKRLAGDGRSAQQMTLAEIKNLQIKNHFNKNLPSQPVATLEEMLLVAKDKIGLMIELKGKTADKQMVDEVVAMLKKHQMTEQAVILATDYDLIKYSEEKYPEIQTGFIYFFVLGDVEQLAADYLIMEEFEADENRVNNIKASGKKVIVWTVNKPASIENFINSDVDGIITDYVGLVRQIMKDSQQRSDFELMIDEVFDY